MTEAPKGRILIADDEPFFLRTTGELLRKEGYECVCVPEAASALEALSNEPFDLVLSDLNMPGNLKLELLKEERQNWPEIPLIVITGVPSLPSAIESIRLGITDYLLKPVKFEDLLSSVRRALRHRWPRPSESETDGGRRHMSSEPFGDILGSCPQMLEVFEIVDRIATTDTSVLITGESGTGKEMVARAIHDRSRRCSQDLRVIDCTAIPESLFESVLFGHAQGSFTGALKDQAGLLADCDGGTIFFDEIGELPLMLQAKLLRVVQAQQFMPVGRNEPVTVDTRFICATNRDLEMEVNTGRFRRDLFYRLAVIHIHLPPLRERGEDVILLANHFLTQLRATNPHIQSFSDEALTCLARHSWPGNIRELRNVVERALAFAQGERIAVSDLPGTLASSVGNAAPRTPIGTEAASRESTLSRAERDYLTDLLRRLAGNVAQSAREAGMSRQGLHKLLRRHGIDAADFRG